MHFGIKRSLYKQTKKYEYENIIKRVRVKNQYVHDYCLYITKRILSIISEDDERRLGDFVPLSVCPPPPYGKLT